MVENHADIKWDGAPQKLEPPDLKLILLGDSAVGKSKYSYISYFRLVERFLLDN